MKSLILLTLIIGLFSIIPFLDVYAEIDSPRNISLKSTLNENPGTTSDVFWLILYDDNGTLVTTSENGVIVIRFDFIDHDKCYDTPDTYCLRATFTDTKNTYFTQPGDEATIILEGYSDTLTFSILSGELVTNTFELNIHDTRLLENHISLQALPSWNEGPAKQRIIDFVELVTSPTSDGFVPADDRIATFDNDGTLWIERPLYIPFAFHLEYLYEQLENDTSLQSQSPYAEILEKKDSMTNHDLKDIPNLGKILLPAYPGISQNEYLQKSKDYLENTNHPRFNVPVKELTFLPMVELIHYLQENDFQVYIVSAGFQGMMMSVSNEIYNIPPENVIGTHPEFISELTDDGTVLIRQPNLATFNDGVEKPVNIQKIIGKNPIFACGNSGGDIEMLKMASFSKHYLGCMVNHDDEIREYHYPNSDALYASDQNNWLVISMKNDFKTVFQSLE